MSLQTTWMFSGFEQDSFGCLLSRWIKGNFNHTQSLSRDLRYRRRSRCDGGTRTVVGRKKRNENDTNAASGEHASDNYALLLLVCNHKSIVLLGPHSLPGYGWRM